MFDQENVTFEETCITAINFGVLTLTRLSHKLSELKANGSITLNHSEKLCLKFALTIAGASPVFTDDDRDCIAAALIAIENCMRKIDSEEIEDVTDQ